MEKKTYGDNKMFYYKSKLYKVLKKSKKSNLVWAWDYADRRRVLFNYADWEAGRRKAFTNDEACELLDRHKTKIFQWIREGLIKPPISVGPGERRNDILNKQRYWWSEDDIMAVQEFMVERIRSGGNNTKIPSKESIRAKINNDEVVLYKMSEDGEYVPVWRAT